MFRLTTLKLSLLSAFATLFLLLAMLAFTGTASAHTTSCQPPNCSPTPQPQTEQITVYGEKWISRDCKSMTVTGASFISSSYAYAYYQDYIQLVAYHFFSGQQLAVNPWLITDNAYGRFSNSITICGFASGGSNAVLYAYDY